MNREQFEAKLIEAINKGKELGILEGYNLGYREGYKNGLEKGAEGSYNRGYEDGHLVAFSEKEER